MRNFALFLAVAILVLPISVYSADRVSVPVVPGEAEEGEQGFIYNSISGALPKNISVIDSISFEKYIPPGNSIAIRVRHDMLELVSDTSTDIPSSWAEALDRTPNWLRRELLLSFQNLEDYSPGSAESFANLIVSSAGPPLTDEVAFCIAHMSPQALLDSRFDPSLLVENARSIYQVADSLSYVFLVERGDFGARTYYTTTRYRILDGADTVWYELPRDIYYWYIVHPKLSDEAVKKRDAGTDEVEMTYGHFWREYLLYDPDPAHSYTEGGYPKLIDVMKVPRVLWSRQDTMYEGMRDFTPDDDALNVLGNWTFRVVPNAPGTVRPIQPNQIAYLHGGNCGEIQDLFAAGARACLIPNICTVNILEDHVWNEFYDGGYDTTLWYHNTPWIYTQVNRWDYEGHTYIDPAWGGYDTERGGSKDLSTVWFYRGDAYPVNRIESYSAVCTVDVYCRDNAGGDPVDGVLLNIFSDITGGEPGMVYLGYQAVTKGNGHAMFLLGDNQPFWYNATSDSLGTVPDEGARTLVASTTAGRRYNKSCTFPASMPEVRCFPTTADSTSDRMIQVTWESPEEVIHGTNYRDSQYGTFTLHSTPGYITLFVCDAANFSLYESGEPFEGILFQKKTTDGELPIHLPYSGVWYLVFTNEDAVANSPLVSANVKLCEDTTAVEEKPFLPGRLSLSVYPSLEVIWQPDKSVASGIYFVRAKAGNKTATRKVVYLR
ncbi:MAG: hypothetical protein B6D65_05725 [candidate division Zixibacteria bacterium 4484_93]|nr:MAG: hypothetical protein B6D65_05725 [candidate division Zixibacteria bacterium 4484_93]